MVTYPYLNPTSVNVISYKEPNVVTNLTLKTSVDRAKRWVPSCFVSHRRHVARNPAPNQESQHVPVSFPISNDFKLAILEQPFIYI